MSPFDIDDHYPGRALSVDDRGYDYGNDPGWELEIEAAPLTERLGPFRRNCPDCAGSDGCTVHMLPKPFHRFCIEKPDHPLPEPSSFGLVLIGALLFLGGNRRR
jgi:hypothetical protein